MAKDIVVLCLDVTPSMNLDPLHGGDTPMEMSLRVARQLVQKRMFAGGKDLIGLVLFGTEDTDNDLASNEGGYYNISVLCQPSNPTVEFLDILTNQIKITPENSPADFIDAIVVSMDLVVGALRDVKKVGEKTIYLLTDVGSGYSDDQVENICTGLKAQDIDLVVIGPTVEDSSGEGTSNGSDSHAPGDDRPGPSHRRPPHRKRTAQQVAGEAMIGRLVEAAEGTCYSFYEALQSSTFIRKNPKRQTSRFTGHLVMGDRLKVPCKIFTKVMVERPDTWKKLSAVSQASACDGNMAVKLQRSYHRNDEDETEVDLDSVAKGYRYGKSLVPISEDDEAAMKFEAARCLSLMGFTKEKNIKQHQLVGTSVQVVVASEENGARALSAMIHALFETEMVGVARYVWRSNSQPKLVALIPKIKAGYECLLMVQLPYMEDIRQFVFGSLPGERPAAQPSDEQLEAVDNLISSMDLMEADMDEEGSSCKALQPKRICNPIIQRTFQCIAHRSLNPDSPLPAVDEAVKNVLQQSATVLADCNANLNRIKDLFTLEVVEKKTKEEGAAAQVWKKTSDLDLDGPPEAKRPRGDDGGEEDVEFSMASLARGAVTKVGTLDPVADFKTLVGKGRFTEASRQLKAVTLDLVKESFGDTLYGKAQDCIKALREEVIKQGDAEVFNDYLRHIKEELQGTRYAAFWEDKVTGEGVTLISSSELSSCSVSPEQAAQFIAAGGADTGVGGASSLKDEDMEDPDNLLDLM